jgi:hypothetical protein
MSLLSPFLGPRAFHVLRKFLLTTVSCANLGDQFRDGQVWQLFGVKADIYDELLHATLSSFLNSLAHRAVSFWPPTLND